ncbi:MAG: TAXI family TRAP transporter solute-binding subunit [Proteobacteria bacterium]|nr:TAXI family TRAP transporter solute-binding subunit [Pseudomonadota bacterium]MDA1057262.1 TAXI family TRAP transporter solute-binding subunit [Pseudomonadota bacterium]
MKLSKFLLATAAATLIAGAAAAQTVGIGTTKGGATAQTSTAIAQIVTEHSGLRMLPQPMGGTQQYIPMVNNGELEFGIANMMQTIMAYTGTGLSEGQKFDNLRLVATMMQFRIGLIVRADSDIHSVQDLKGKRLPSGYSASPLFLAILDGMLANGGLTFDDVQKVPVTGLVPGINAFKEGKIDAVIGSVGAGFVNDASAAVGGIRFVSFDPSPAAARAFSEKAPRTYLKEVAPGLTGIDKPTQIMFFDYMLWAGKDVSDDVVYKITKAMHENEAQLHGFGPLWETHTSATMSKDQDMPYHPGAIKFYKEAGAWHGS